MKQWKPPRLSRGGRTVRNLALVLLLLTYMWVQYQCPIRSTRLDFRRAERDNLIGPCEIQGVFDIDRQGWVAAVSGDQVILWGELFREMGYWPRRTGETTLVPVPTRAFGLDREREIVAVDVPEGTASARLELTLSCWHDRDDLSLNQMICASPDLFDTAPLWWERTWTADGELLRDGGVLFRVASPDEHTDASVNTSTVERMALGQVVYWEAYRQPAVVRGANCHMEAVFCGADGQELGRAALSTPEEGK